MTRGPMPLGYLSIACHFRTLAYSWSRLGRSEVFLRDIRNGRGEGFWRGA